MNNREIMLMLIVGFGVYIVTKSNNDTERVNPVIPDNKKPIDIEDNRSICNNTCGTRYKRRIHYKQ